MALGDWFSITRSQREGWRLDIVSLLAVIGEGAMEAHMQPMTSNWTCVLPRIMPAPQTLLKPSRPTRMPQLPASVVGVSSGTHVTSLNFFPNIIHPIDALPAFTFQLWEIRHKQKDDNEMDTTPGKSIKSSSEKTVATGIELGVVEAQIPGGMRKREGTITSLTRVVTKRLIDDKPHIPTKNFSPLNLLSVLSCMLTIGLVIWAALIEDGTACVALGCISVASCIVGYATKWTPILKKRVFRGYVPKGDVVIRTREGAFIVVKCNEEVARELYTGTEECEYFSKARTYRVLVGFGTMLLMVSTVLLGNCDFPMQAAIGGSYIALNGAFWLVSLRENSAFWDLSIYEYVNKTPADALAAHVTEDGPKDDQERIASYTRTLWYAIRETGKDEENGEKGSIDWATISGAVPVTRQWAAWLKEAAAAARAKNTDWKAAERRAILVGRADPAILGHDSHRTNSDSPSQSAPATEIPPPLTR